MCDFCKTKDGRTIIACRTQSIINHPIERKTILVMIDCEKCGAKNAIYKEEDDYNIRCINCHNLL